MVDARMDNHVTDVPMWMHLLLCVHVTYRKETMFEAAAGMMDKHSVVTALTIMTVCMH